EATRRSGAHRGADPSARPAGGADLQRGAAARRQPCSNGDASMTGRRGWLARLIRRDAEPQPESPVELRAIGVVRSSYRDPRRMMGPEQEATIELLPEHVPALSGLDGFSHIFVLTWLDRVAEEER